MSKTNNSPSVDSPKDGGSAESKACSFIGANVKAMREKKGMSIRTAANEAGVSEVWLSNLEKGKTDNASLKNLFAVCKAVGLDCKISLTS